MLSTLASGTVLTVIGGVGMYLGIMARATVNLLFWLLLAMLCAGPVLAVGSLLAFAFIAIPWRKPFGWLAALVLVPVVAIYVLVTIAVLVTSWTLGAGFGLLVAAMLAGALAYAIRRGTRVPPDAAPPPPPAPAAPSSAIGVTPPPPGVMPPPRVPTV